MTTKHKRDRKAAPMCECAMLVRDLWSMLFSHGIIPFRPPYICSKELFHLLAPRETENRTVLCTTSYSRTRARAWTFCARCTDADHGIGTQREIGRHTHLKLVRRKTNTKSIRLMCTFRANSFRFWCLDSLSDYGKIRVSNLELQLNIMRFIIVVTLCQGRRETLCCARRNMFHVHTFCGCNKVRGEERKQNYRVSVAKWQ